MSAKSNRKKENVAVVAVDPGPEFSAVIVYDGNKPLYWDYTDNESVLVMMSLWSNWPLAIEMIEGMGQVVGKSVFETAYWVGRMVEAHRGDYNRIGRRTVKLHLCGTLKSRDTDVRKAIIARFGGRIEALGSRKEPGPLRCLKSHLWSAMAVALTWWDLHRGLEVSK